MCVVTYPLYMNRARDRHLVHTGPGNGARVRQRGPADDVALHPEPRHRAARPGLALKHSHVSFDCPSILLSVYYVS